MSTWSVFGPKEKEKEKLIDSVRLSQPSLNKGDDKNFQDMLALVRTSACIGSKKLRKVHKRTQRLQCCCTARRGLSSNGYLLQFPMFCLSIQVFWGVCFHGASEAPLRAAKVLHNRCLASHRGHLLWISKGEKSTEGIRVGSSPKGASCALLKQTIERLENRGVNTTKGERWVQWWASFHQRGVSWSSWKQFRLLTWED